jgi:hypothetical protein
VRQPAAVFKQIVAASEFYERCQRPRIATERGGGSSLSEPTHWHIDCRPAFLFNQQDPLMSSFRQKSPGVLASSLIGAAIGLALVAGPIALLSYAAVSGQDHSATLFASQAPDAVADHASNFSAVRN